MDFGKDHIIDHEDGTDFMARVFRPGDRWYQCEVF